MSLRPLHQPQFMHLSHTVVSRGHTGISIDGTYVGVGLTERMDFLFKMMGIAAPDLFKGD